MKKKLIILGAGESGVGAALLGQKEGWDVMVSDGKLIKSHYRLELQAAGIAFEENGHSIERILQADLVVKSPGIPTTAPLIQKIKESKIPIISEIEFASRYTDASIIAITGTNGKTTTTLLTHFLLTEAGLSVGLAGNVGESFARKVATETHEWYVLEVSSFQLDDIDAFRPKIATILNITPDHLDRYGYDMSRYAASKFQIVRNMAAGDTFIYNADDEWICGQLNELEKTLFGSEPFGQTFFDGEKLTIPLPTSLESQMLNSGNASVKFTDLPLPGKHNAMNIAVALMIALRAGIEVSVLGKALPHFINTAHRMELIATIHGVKYINDSKATNVEAAKYALDSFWQPIVWIAGGQDKGNDYQQLEQLVKTKVKAMICLGADNTKLIDAFGELVPYYMETKSVVEAVKAAYQYADKGDVVLLSPACASFDLFENYIARGDQFRKTVQKLAQELEVNV